MEPEKIVKGAVDPILRTVDQTVAFGLVDPGPVAELVFGLLLLVLVIIVHGWSMARISRRFARMVAVLPDAAPAWRVNMLLWVTIGLLALTHILETLIWAGPIWASGLIRNFRDSYYFVLETYTTLGDASIELPEAWRLIGPLIAISGLFAFSWTGSVLVYVVGETGRRHAAAAKARNPGDPAP